MEDFASKIQDLLRAFGVPSPVAGLVGDEAMVDIFKPEEFLTRELRVMYENTLLVDSFPSQPPQDQSDGSKENQKGAPDIPEPELSQLIRSPLPPGESWDGESGKSVLEAWKVHLMRILTEESSDGDDSEMKRLRDEFELTREAGLSSTPCEDGDIFESASAISNSTKLSVVQCRECGRIVLVTRFLEHTTSCVDDKVDGSGSKETVHSPMKLVEPMDGKTVEDTKDPPENSMYIRKTHRFSRFSHFANDGEVKKLRELDRARRKTLKPLAQSCGRRRVRRCQDWANSQIGLENAHAKKRNTAQDKKVAAHAVSVGISLLPVGKSLSQRF